MAEPGFSFNTDVAPVCEVGMSDVRQAEPDTWLDISCHVHEAELFRGRERFNDRFQPGTATITLTNDDGWADLVGDYSQVESQKLRPGRPIRVGVTGPFDGGPIVTRWLWRGFIDQATPSYDPVAHDTIVVNCIDAFGEAGLTDLLPGPLVGVNERVDQRINRALDAVGWWGSKRNIAVGTALMQGTELGGQSSDLMTSAADSAGGVVFGDTVGRVAYKDIDWELYDPDTAPDGEIGNCDPSMPPSGGTPPYLDPTLGVVYDAPPPPPTHPAVTHFCLGPDQAGGTVIERGAAYRIFIKVARDGNQHMYLTENGHTYDMGVWEPEGGCTTITHPSQNGTFTPPTRVDDPTPENPTPPVITGPEVPPGPEGPPPPGTEPPPVIPGVTFGVELVGYDDGATSVDHVTVAGISPGAGVMLIALICAKCDGVAAGSLRPFPIASGSITGGGTTWDEIAFEIAGGDGMESYAAVTHTARTDPGTFDVTVDWSQDHRSSYHIVTVWKISAEADDLADRMRAGAYIRAFTWDRMLGVLPAPVNPPGKGPFQLELTNPSVDTPPFPALTDVVIAQSLAESPTPPFGASFDNTDGAWWTPIFIETAAAATLDADPATPPVCDDLERPTLGPDWELGVPALDPGFAAHSLFAIDTGTAIMPLPTFNPGDVFEHPARQWSMQPVAPFDAPDQFMEITVDEAWQGHPGTDSAGYASRATYRMTLLRSDTPYDISEGNDVPDVHTGVGRSVEITVGTFRFGNPAIGTTVHNELTATLIDTYDDGGVMAQFNRWADMGNFDYTDHPTAPVKLRFEAYADGRLIVTMDDALVLAAEATNHLPAGIGQQLWGQWILDEPEGTPETHSPRIDMLCRGRAEGGIVRKCSWVAGYRPDTGAGPAPTVSVDTVSWDEVNFGPDDYQSCQACVVVSPRMPDSFGWHVLAYYAHALDPSLAVPTIPPLSHSSTIRYGRNSVLVVFVAAFAAPNVTGGITVTSSTGLTFTRTHTQIPDSVGHGQGVVFTAKTPALAAPLDPAPTVTVAWDATLEGVSYLIYEVTNGGSVGAHGSAVTGTHILGSADGPIVATLPAAPATSSLVLGFLGVLGQPNEGGADEGAGFTEEIEYLPVGEWAWLQAESRSGSADPAVPWADLNASTLQMSDAVALAVEVVPGPDYVDWETTDPLAIGGSTDAFDGPIFSAEERDAAGDVIWSFQPGDYV